MKIVKLREEEIKILKEFQGVLATNELLLFLGATRVNKSNLPKEVTEKSAKNFITESSKIIAMQLGNKKTFLQEVIRGHKKDTISRYSAKLR